MGADSPAKNPQMPQTLSAQSVCPICLPNLSAQAQKLWISMKKASLGVRSSCSNTRKLLFQHLHYNCNFSQNWRLQFFAIKFNKLSKLLIYMDMFYPLSKDLQFDNHS